MNFNKIFLSVAFACISLAAAAEDCLVVHLSGGKKVAFAIAKRPKVTFDGGVVCIQTERLQIQNVKKYTIEDVDLVNIETAVEDNEERLQLKGSTAYVRTTGNEPVKCYTVDGIELPVRKKNEGNGVVSVDLSEIDQPVVILTVGEESIKIRRK